MSAHGGVPTSSRRALLAAAGGLVGGLGGLAGAPGTALATPEMRDQAMAELTGGAPVSDGRVIQCCRLGKGGMGASIARLRGSVFRHMGRPSPD